MNEFLVKIKEEAYTAANELIAAAKLGEGDILVVGCSSSEVAGERIGTSSSYDTAEAVFDGISEAAEKAGIYIAAQCCEHLNRAVIISREAAKRERLETVNVIPLPKAGGSFATAAYKKLADPCAVEEISADAGLDIGDTLIGMHLKKVAVPLRLSLGSIGYAHLTAARVRPKFIGGIRAVYDEALL